MFISGLLYSILAITFIASCANSSTLNLPKWGGTNDTENLFHLLQVGKTRSREDFPSDLPTQQNKKVYLSEELIPEAPLFTPPSKPKFSVEHVAVLSVWVKRKHLPLKEILAHNHLSLKTSLSDIFYETNRYNALLNFLARDNDLRPYFFWPYNRHPQERNALLEILLPKTLCENGHLRESYPPFEMAIRQLKDDLRYNVPDVTSSLIREAIRYTIINEPQKLETFQGSFVVFQKLTTHLKKRWPLLSSYEFYTQPMYPELLETPFLRFFFNYWWQSTGDAPHQINSALDKQNQANDKDFIFTLLEIFIPADFITTVDEQFEITSKSLQRFEKEAFPLSTLQKSVQQHILVSLTHPHTQEREFFWKSCLKIKQHFYDQKQERFKIPLQSLDIRSFDYFRNDLFENIDSSANPISSFILAHLKPSLRKVIQESLIHDLLRKSLCKLFSGTNLLDMIQAVSTFQAKSFKTLLSNPQSYLFTADNRVEIIKKLRRNNAPALQAILENVLWEKNYQGNTPKVYEILGTYTTEQLKALKTNLDILPKSLMNSYLHRTLWALKRLEPSDYPTFVYLLPYLMPSHKSAQEYTEIMEFIAENFSNTLLINACADICSCGLLPPQHTPRTLLATYRTLAKLDTSHSSYQATMSSVKLYNVRTLPNLLNWIEQQNQSQYQDTSKVIGGLAKEIIHTQTKN